MYKIFETLAEYNQFTDNGTHLTAGILYLVKENKSLYFLTNNIDGEAEKYEYLDEIPEGYIKPEGNIIITENGENIDIAQYATATVNVAGSGGNEDLIDLIEMDITTLNIPNGTTKIGKDAFYYCSSLTNVTIPDSVTSIGQNAFYYCSSLTSITIPDSVTSIGGSAFNNCRGLTSINIPNGVTTIGNSTFYGCSSLTSIIIPDSVTSIDGSAFSSCSGLTSVTIGSGVISISNNVFDSCSSLTSITIPDSVTSIGGSAFNKCRSLTSVTINATTPPTLGSTVFSSTNTNLVIYVPAETVDAYKAATNWKTYASRIQPIPTE